MPLQEISVFFPPSLAILSGMALQGLALLLRCRPLLICGAFLAVAAALAERDAAFIAGQLLILCLCWRKNTVAAGEKGGAAIKKGPAAGAFENRGLPSVT